MNATNFFRSDFHDTHIDYCPAQRAVMVAAWQAYEENLMEELRSKGLLNLPSKRHILDDAELTPEVLKIINKREKEYLTMVKKYGMIRKIDDSKLKEKK